MRVEHIHNNTFILSYVTDGRQTNSIIQSKAMCACFSTDYVVLSFEDYVVIGGISHANLSKLLKMRVLYSCPNCLTRPIHVWNGLNANSVQIVKSEILKKIVVNVMGMITRDKRYDASLITHIIPNCYDRDCNHSVTYICNCDEEDIQATAAMITVDGHLPLDMYQVLIEMLRLQCIFINVKCSNCMRPYQCEDDGDGYFCDDSRINYKGSTYDIRYTNEVYVG